jgi:two-component system chemotaxis response regulator CheY
MRILVVDDSRVARNIVKNMLKAMYNVEEGLIEASNGEEAWSVLQSSPIDLVLLDWNMALLNGIDLLRRLRQTDKFKTLPVIMITSEAAKYNVIEAVKAGINDYLIKPLTEKNLYEKVRKYIVQEGSNP